MTRQPGLSALVAGLLLLAFIHGARADDGIVVQSVSSTLLDNVCYVDARIDFNLHEDLQEALDHGVDLDVRIIIRVREQRKWFRDRLYKQEMIEFKLDHLLLSNVYIVTDIGASRQRQFDTLENALNYLGTLDRYPLFENKTGLAGTNLRGSLKAELNVENLPPPLKPVAFLLDKWSSASDWHRWMIHP